MPGTRANKVMQIRGLRTFLDVDASSGLDWSLAVSGDGEALGRVFDALHDRVYRHALGLTRDTHDAEDVLGGAFLELWRRRKDVRTVDGSVLPWLLVTTTHLALNQRRGLRRHRRFLAQLPRQEPTTEAAEGVALTNATLDISPELLDGIRSLSDADQQLLALVALEGYPIRAAAEALGLTEATARSRWQRIRKRLAASLPQAPEFACE